MALTLEGQVAVISGGGRGIGRTVAQVFAQSGAAVALVGRSVGPLEEVAAAICDAGGRALALPTDITESEAVKDSVARAEQDLGPIDVLVNAAGSFFAVGPVWEVDPDQWWRDVEVNLRGTFLCSRAVLPGMIRCRRGKIINFHGGGSTTPLPYGSGYAASKAAVLRFTDTLAQEVSTLGVQVYAISPGLVMTDMTRHKLDTPEGQKWMPRLQTLVEQGKDVPPERGAGLAVQLAALQGDALSGRVLSIADDVRELAEGAAVIASEDRYALRLRK